MDSNINLQKPDWLTDSAIASLKKDIMECPTPYTKEEVEELEYDGLIDMKRYNAYVAKKLLTKYGMI